MSKVRKLHKIKVSNDPRTKAVVELAKKQGIHVIRARFTKVKQRDWPGLAIWFILRCRTMWFRRDF